METIRDEAYALRRTLLQKINCQRSLAISSLALLFADEPRLETRKAVAERFRELADYVLTCDRSELWRFSRSLHVWRRNSPLSMPSLSDLVRDAEAADYSRN